MALIGSYVFFVDEGAVYDVDFHSDGEAFATARRTGTVYRSFDHLMQLTGKRRRQAAGLGGYRVDGHRAILHLDTGEGISELRGVAV